MTFRRLVAATVITTVLCAGTVTPRRAQAVDTAVLVISSIAAYVAFIAIGAYFVFRGSENPPFLASEVPPDAADEPGSGVVRPGFRCAQRDGQVTVVCW